MTPEILRNWEKTVSSFVKDYEKEMATMHERLILLEEEKIKAITQASVNALLRNELQRNAYVTQKTIGFQSDVYESERKVRVLAEKLKIGHEYIQALTAIQGGKVV